MSITIGEALALGKAALQGTADNSDFDAEVLLCHVLDTGKATLIAWPERELSDAQNRQYVELLEQRKQGVPVAYLQGQREFWSLDLAVNPDVLIPRPDTELLVEVALELGNQLENQLGPESNLNIADLGTGSGAIALALCHEKPHWHITATDLSPEALEVARENAHDLKLCNLTFLEGHWYTPLPRDRRFHLILSNPPYVAQGDPHLLGDGLPFEPHSALVSGPQGLDDLAQIIHSAPYHLYSGGWLLVEHGFDQGDAVQQLFHKAGLQQIATHQDLAGQDRVTLGCYPGSQ